MSKYVPPHLRKQDGANSVVDGGSGSVVGGEGGSGVVSRRAEASPPAQRQNRDKDPYYHSRSHNYGGGDQQRHHQHSNFQQHREQSRNDRDGGHNQHQHRDRDRDRDRESATSWGRDHHPKEYHQQIHEEKRIYFRSDRGPLLVGKNHRNIHEIKNKTRIASIDVPHGRGVVTVRGPELSEVEKAVSRCAAKLAAVERKEKSPEAVIFLYSCSPSKSSQRFRFEKVVIESELQNWDTASSSTTNALYRIRLATPEEIVEEQKHEEQRTEKQKRSREEDNDFWKLTFGGDASPSSPSASSTTSATLPIVEEKHFYLNTHNLVKHIIKAHKNQVLAPLATSHTTSIPPAPSSPSTPPAADFLELSVSSSFGRCIFLNIPEDRLSKNYSLNELHALLEKERYRFFFRWGVPNDAVEKLQAGLEKEKRTVEGKEPKIINSNIKQAGVVVGDHQGTHYKTVQIQKWEEEADPVSAFASSTSTSEAVKTEQPPQQADQEQTGAKKKKKKKKKKKNANTPEATPSASLLSPPGLSFKPLSPTQLKYQVFNGREMQINICMIGAPYDTQIIISEGAVAKNFQPSEDLLSFVSQLKIEEATGKLATPANSQFIYPPRSSKGETIYYLKSSNLQYRDYVFGADGFTLQVEMKVEKDEKEKEKELKESTITTRPSFTRDSTILVDDLLTKFGPFVEQIGKISNFFNAN